MPTLNQMLILPRLLRLKDAPFYLGMDRHKFNNEVRPYITEIRDQGRGVRFDRLDLDRWVDNINPAMVVVESLQKERNNGKTTTYWTP